VSGQAVSPQVFVAHRLPGRIRLRIMPVPRHARRLEQDLRGHPGILSFGMSSVSGSVLIRYDVAEIAEAEVVVRVALSLSVQNDMAPVRLVQSSEGQKLDPYATASGLLLLATGVLRYLPSMRPRVVAIDALAGIGTSGAIVAHAAGDLRRHGAFHPETLSVVYLAVSFIQGNPFSAAVLTWFASFGRHFRGRFEEELVLHAEPTGGRGRKRRYGVTLEQGTRRLAGNSALQYVPALIAHAFAGGKPGDDSFLEDVDQVSERHGHMLEGLEGMENGISIQIRR
jgi:hypothetical protein